MKKIVINLLLSFALVFCTSCSLNYFGGENEDSFNTTETESGLELTHYTGTSEEITIPKMIDGKKLVKIGGYNEGGSYMGAFHDSKCRTVKISSDIKEIEFEALSSAQNLERIEVDENNKYFTDIDGVLFSKDKKVLLCIPANYSGNEYSIPKGTVCAQSLIYNNLEVLTIPETLEMIDIDYNYPAWYYSSDNIASYKLKSINVKSSNKYFKSQDGVLYSKDGSELLIFPENSDITEFKVPSSVKTIKRFYTNRMKNLQKLYVGKNVKTIEMESDYDYDLADEYRPAALIIEGYKASKIYDWYQLQNKSEYLKFQVIG